MPAADLLDDPLLQVFLDVHIREEQLPVFFEVNLFLKGTKLLVYFTLLYRVGGLESKFVADFRQNLAEDFVYALSD